MAEVKYWTSKESDPIIEKEQTLRWRVCFLDKTGPNRKYVMAESNSLFTVISIFLRVNWRANRRRSK